MEIFVSNSQKHSCESKLIQPSGPNNDESFEIIDNAVRYAKTLGKLFKKLLSLLFLQQNQPFQ